MSDSTKVGFDPFADQKKTFSLTQNIGSGTGGSLPAWLPWVALALVALLVWRMFK